MVQLVIDSLQPFWIEEGILGAAVFTSERHHADILSVISIFMP